MLPSPVKLSIFKSDVSKDSIVSPIKFPQKTSDAPGAVLKTIISLIVILIKDWSINKTYLGLYLIILSILSSLKINNEVYKPNSNNLKSKLY